jgi:hypothetical protein
MQLFCSPQLEALLEEVGVEDRIRVGILVPLHCERPDLPVAELSDALLDLPLLPGQGEIDHCLPPGLATSVLRVSEQCDSSLALCIHEALVAAIEPPLSGQHLVGRRLGHS